MGFSIFPDPFKGLAAVFSQVKRSLRKRKTRRDALEWHYDRKLGGREFRKLRRLLGEVGLKRIELKYRMKGM